MNNDSSRTHVSLKLRCYECGSLLSTSYAEPKKRTNTHSEGEPTGVANRDMYLTVYPCSCTRKAENDLKALKEILKN